MIGTHYLRVVCMLVVLIICSITELTNIFNGGLHDLVVGPMWTIDKYEAAISGVDRTAILLNIVN